MDFSGSTASRVRFYIATLSNRAVADSQSSTESAVLWTFVVSSSLEFCPFCDLHPKKKSNLQADVIKAPVEVSLNGPKNHALEQRKLFSFSIYCHVFLVKLNDLT